MQGKHITNNMKTMNDYCRETFGKKLYKLSLDGGFTCPNRDGTKGTGGCIFCSSHGSGDFAVKGNDINEQIEKAKGLVSHKNKNGGYIAYFQNFTSTYAPVERLEKIFYEAISHPDIDVLSVATRPDCLGDDITELLGRLNKIKPVWVELGLQTVKEESIKYIRRCYENSEYESAVKRLHGQGIYVITHMIIGLPGEIIGDMTATLDFIIKNKSDGIKLQLLHILKDSDLYDEYLKGNVRELSEGEYIHILKNLLPLIPANMAVHRLTGDGNKKTLAAPLWTGNKKSVLNNINKMINSLTDFNSFTFRRIKREELPGMFNLILSRVAWMDKVGIKQWNTTDYANVYPLSYYEEKHDKGEVFVLAHKENDNIIACAVLRHEDERWHHVEDIREDEALYLHNFASDLSFPSAGSVFLYYAEKYAREEGKKYFRLDSADDNKVLEGYYAEKGYYPAGECTDGPYKGILRQKKL